MISLYYLLVFVVGLVAGSFLNCLIYRLYNKKSLMGRSFCPQCQHKIHWFDNIPVVSFILLQGRCRYCQQKIFWQYPLVELASGFLFLFSFLSLFSKFHFLSSIFYLALVRDWLIIFALMFIFVYDLKYYIIEDVVILPIAVIVFALNIILGLSWFHILLSGLGAALFFLAQYWLTHGRGIGLGDFRIGILMGVYFGWPYIFLAILFSYLIGGIVGLILILTKRKKWASAVPLGPFLVIGSLITMFLGQQIINTYLPNF